MCALFVVWIGWSLKVLKLKRVRWDEPVLSWLNLVHASRDEQFPGSPSIVTVIDETHASTNEQCPGLPSIGAVVDEVHPDVLYGAVSDENACLHRGSFACCLVSSDEQQLIPMALCIYGEGCKKEQRVVRRMMNSNLLPRSSRRRRFACGWVFRSQS